METLHADLRFQTPCGVQISGPTMSGKSTLVRNIIQHNTDLFFPAPKRIVYVYGTWQKEFNVINNVEFVKDLNTVLEEDYFDQQDNTLLILDDLMEEISKHKTAATLFTRGVHHKNVSVLFLSQNLFKQGKSMRDIALNCQYLILFKTARDVQQVNYLARQTGLTHLALAYRKATLLPYGCLLINLHPKTPEVLRLQFHIFSHRRIYI